MDNRAFGDRLSILVSFEALKLAAGVVLLSPFIPLLFMGEEYGETAPFQCFISYADPHVIEAVSTGRGEEFAWQGEPPDPQDESTFRRSGLDHALRRQEPHGTLWEFDKELIALRRKLLGFALLSKKPLEVHGFERQKVRQIRRWSDAGEALVAANFGNEGVSVTLPIPAGTWREVLDSADRRWKGSGSCVAETLNSNGQSGTAVAFGIVSCLEPLIVGS